MQNQTSDFLPRKDEDIDPWHPPFFKLYRKRELLHSWDTARSKKLFPIELERAVNNNLVDVVIVKNAMEACVIAAMFMREVCARPESAYFTMEDMALYLRYDTLLLNTVQGVTIENARKRAAKTIQQCFSEDYCSAITKDVQGYPLFYETPQT
jgi:hypothetical protein